MKTFQTFGRLLLLGAALTASAQERVVRQATDAEVAAGSNVKAYVNPKQYQDNMTGGGGGPTNGITLVQGTNIINGSTGVIATNGAARGTTFQFTTTGTNVIVALERASDASGTNNPVFSTVSTTNGGVSSVSTFSTTVIDSGHNSAVQTALTASTSGSAAFTELAANYFVGTFLGNGVEITNLLNSTTLSAGANITLTLTKNAVTGSTNYQVALTSPANLSQVNVGTAWLTNTVTPTNTFAGTLADFGKGFSITNLGGNLTFTGVANLTAGAHNSCIVEMKPAGADRTIGVPASWHIARGANLVVSNAFDHSDFLVTANPGVNTNIVELDFP